MSLVNDDSAKILVTDATDCNAEPLGAPSTQVTDVNDTGENVFHFLQHFFYLVTFRCLASREASL